MTERRYDEAEVARIFEEATRRALADGPSSGRTLPASDGLTLAQLQEIGAEVGLSPEAVAAGAAVVEGGASPIDIAGSTLGVPHGVAGSVPLPREPTDREWGIIVGHLRDTFRAHGTLESDGAMRSWRNGNLQFRVEPGGSGPVLRMRTYKSDGKVLPWVGGGLSAGGSLFAVLLGTFNDPEAAAVMGTLLVPVGLLMLGAGYLTVPRWARTRKSQMEQVAALALKLTSQPPALPKSAGDAGDVQVTSPE